MQSRGGVHLAAVQGALQVQLQGCVVTDPIVAATAADGTSDVGDAEVLVKIWEQRRRRFQPTGGFGSSQDVKLAAQACLASGGRLP